MFIKERVGIIIDMSGRHKRTNGRRSDSRTIKLPRSHMTSHSVTLPQGCVLSDEVHGLWFLIDVEDEKAGKFYLSWNEIMEVRDLEGNCFLRNWNLCPNCRQLVKIFRGNKHHCVRCDIFFDSRDPDPGIGRYKGDSEL